MAGCPGAGLRSGGRPGEENERITLCPELHAGSCLAAAHPGPAHPRDPRDTHAWPPTALVHVSVRDITPQLSISTALARQSWHKPKRRWCQPRSSSSCRTCFLSPARPAGCMPLTQRRGCRSAEEGREEVGEGLGEAVVVDGACKSGKQRGPATRASGGAGWGVGWPGRAHGLFAQISADQRRSSRCVPLIHP